MEENKSERVGERLEGGVGQSRHEGLDKFEPEKFEFVSQAFEAGNGGRRSFGYGVFSAHGS
jgi:hypothetical protein